MASIFADIHAVGELKREMETYADDIYACNQAIDAILQELNSESSGAFADDLKTAACSLIDFAFDLFKAMMSGLKALGDVAENLSKMDEEGANSLKSTGAFRSR